MIFLNSNHTNHSKVIPGQCTISRQHCVFSVFCQKVVKAKVGQVSLLLLREPTVPCIGGSVVVVLYTRLGDTLIFIDTAEFLTIFNLHILCESYLTEQGLYKFTRA